MFTLEPLLSTSPAPSRAEITAFLDGIPHWQQGPTVSVDAGTVKTYKTCHGPEVWAARVSHHPKETYPAFARYLAGDEDTGTASVEGPREAPVARPYAPGTAHTYYESLYYPIVESYLIVPSVRPGIYGAAIRFNLGRFLAPRQFNVWVEVHPAMTGSPLPDPVNDPLTPSSRADDLPVSFMIALYVRDGGADADATLGRYSSFERVTLDATGVIWEMATCSDAGGYIPRWVQNAVICKELTKDVDLFVNWMART